MKKLFKTTAALVAAFVVSGAALGSPVVSLTWIDNSTNEEGFIVERALPNKEFVEIGRTSEDIATFEDNDPQLVSGQTVSYRVCAYNRFGKSGYTNEAQHELFPNRYLLPIDGTPSEANAVQISSITINTDSVTVIRN